MNRTLEEPAVVAIDGLAKAFGHRALLRNVDLRLVSGTVSALTGPSGTGKTTLLRLIAGLETADAGDIVIDGRLATSGRRLLLEPHQRGIGMVFQQPALWPHMNVRGQVMFGLADLDAAEAAARTEVALRLAEVGHLATARPASLSGGEAARVALARALAPKPRCLLFDEPLAHLDGPLRRGLAATIRRITRETGATVLIVTHTPDDLSGVTDRVLRLVDGQLRAG
jgi:iron(III) transport system ATP-binding protein